MQQIKRYYALTKPGIVYGNLLHAVAAGLFAFSLVRVNFLNIVWMALGLALVVASACTFNCIMDRKIDAKMERTKKRPLPMKYISIKNAIIFASLLLLLGLLVLYYVNIWVLGCALIGHIAYTLLYGYVKRVSWVSTMVGTIPGAMPIFVGYLAVDLAFTSTAWLLWVIVLLWQMPHFYALAVLKKSDYAKTELPLMSVVKPRKMIVGHMIFWAILYGVSTIIFLYFAPVNVMASFILAAVSLWWVYVVIGATNKGTDRWAGRVFGTSLYLPIAMLVCSIIAVAVT